MQHSPWGGIKRCSPSVCLSVCQSIYCLRFSRNRKAIETSNLVDPETERWRKVTRKQIKVERSKVKVTAENESAKFVFRACLLQKRIGLRQTKTKLITGPFCTYLLTLGGLEVGDTWVKVTEMEWEKKLSMYNVYQRQQYPGLWEPRAPVAQTTDGVTRARARTRLSENVLNTQKI